MGYEQSAIHQENIRFYGTERGMPGRLKGMNLFVVVVGMRILGAVVQRLCLQRQHAEKHANGKREWEGFRYGHPFAIQR
jgi:hypothetical protein